MNATPPAGVGPSRRKRGALRLAVLVLTPFLSAAAIESVFRYCAWELNQQSLESAFTVLPEKSPSGRTRFIDIIEPHPDDHIIFELRPNYSGEYYAKKLTTNSFGFRGPEVSLQAQPGEVTVVGIGASIMFGHGVADGQDLLSLLGQGLNAAHPERTWRVINTSVPSYNVVQKVETLRVKGLQFHPDLVVLEIASNNLDLPNYVRVEEDPFDWHRSFLLDFFREQQHVEMATAERNAMLASVNKDKLSWNDKVASDPDKIPPRYRDLVGWGPFDKALDELKQMSEENGFEVVVVANLEVDLAGQMLDEARQRGFATVSVMKDLQDYIRNHYHEEFTLDRYCRSELVVNKENVHPSAFQHRMIAERLLREMSRSGMVDRLLAKVPAAAAAAAAGVGVGEQAQPSTAASSSDR